MEKTKSKPELRFPEFSGEWETKKLGEISNWSSGGTPSKDNPAYWNGSIPWISASSMHGLEYSDSELKITTDGLKNGSKLAPKGCLLILVRGSMLFNKIPIGITTKDVAFNQDVKSISIGQENNIKFILYWFNSFESIILNMVTGTGIGAGKLDLIDLKGLIITLPTLPEQTRIATFLTSVDLKLTQLKKKKSFLEQYKKGVMQKIFNQKIRFKDDDGNEFPEWEEKKLGELCEMAKSGGTPKSTNPDFYDGDIPFLSISDMTFQGKYLKYSSNHISKLGLDNSASWIVPVNTIIYSMYASVGFVSINTIPIATSQAVLNLILKKNISVEFVYYSLVQFQVKTIKFITTGTQGNLNAHTVKSFETFLPCLPEQTKIANLLSTIDEKINQCSAQIGKMELWKKGLLQKMFI